MLSSISFATGETYANISLLLIAATRKRKVQLWCFKLFYRQKAGGKGGVENNGYDGKSINRHKREWSVQVHIVYLLRGIHIFRLR